MATTKSTIDPYNFLQIVINSDGSITRNSARFPNASPTPDLDSPTAVLSKDLPIDQSNQTWARLYLPREAPEFFPSEKLPLVVYFHGGGFIYCSAASTIFHKFCENIALDLQVAILSVDYRLSQHRLPAAYDDAVEALHWIRNCDDDWLRLYVDFSNCYIMGSSSGGAIAYHAGLRVADNGVDHLRPITIKGLILHHPFFGGVKRCESEIRLTNDSVFPPRVADLMWELSLPIGVDRDHKYSNPTAGGWSKQLEKIKRVGWKVLVIGCDGDPLMDRQIELVKLMVENGVKDVVGQFGVGGHHVVEIRDPSHPMVKDLHLFIKKFIFN